MSVLLFFPLSLLDSNDDSDGSSSDNDFFEAPAESSGTFYHKPTRKRLSTESSNPVSDDEFGLRRKRSMSSDINQREYYSPPPMTSDSDRKLSASSDQGRQLLKAVLISHGTKHEACKL